MGLNYSLFKGVSIQLNGSALDLEPDTAHMKISSLPVVKKAWPVRLIPRPDSQIISQLDGPASVVGADQLDRRADEADTFSPHVMNQVDKMRAAGFTGKGVRIAIIDSGVDYNNPALGACFGPGCAVSFGKDLVGDSYNGSNTPIPDSDPWTQCDSHGTHVTGIIAARENPLGFTGAAPGADVGMYRVFGCSGDVATDIMVAAFNTAFEDGADVITASIGGSVGWAEEAWAASVSRIVDAGVPCTVAAGNSGSAGLFYASSAADGHGVTAVGSVENTQAPYVMIGGDAVVDGAPQKWGWAYGAPSLPNVTLPLWVVTPNDTTDGTWGLCNPLKDSVTDLSGKIVLVEYDICGSWTEANYLQERGAEYVLFYYREPSVLFHPSCTSFPSIKGCAMTPYQQGVEWRNLLTNGSSITLTVTDKEHAATVSKEWPNTVTGGYMDSFSSWGPTWEVDVVPSFSTAGGSIVSTFPLSQGGYAVDSGTSMATPLMAAIYALVIEARGNKDPSFLRNLISATAQPLGFHNGTVAVPGLAPVPQQGAGLVQAYRAAFETTLLNVSSISFNDSDHFVGQAAFELKNTGSESVTYSLGNSPALTMYTYSTTRAYPAAFPNPSADGSASLAFSTDSITLAPGSTAAIVVTVTPPAGLDESRIPVYSGYITLNTTSGDNLVLPYLGVVGSLHNLTMVDPDLMFLMNSTVYPYEPVEANTTWTLAKPTSPVIPNTDPRPYPTFLIQLTSGTAFMRVDIEPLGATLASVATTDVFGTKSAGNVAGFPLDWIPRRFFITPFSGMTQEGTILPPGSYRMVVRILKIFGDRENPDDYRTITLEPFSIKYQCKSRKRSIGAV
ncbi:subtilisin-like protein [Thozetella sp. PMI_491]|nr:subtilisin-like protein [Thozetella sp. PMI_491]